MSGIKKQGAKDSPVGHSAAPGALGSIATDGSVAESQLGSVHSWERLVEGGSAALVASIPGKAGRAVSNEGARAVLVSGAPRARVRSQRAAGGALSVIEQDERMRVVDTRSDPWRMICSLEISSERGSFVGTGWLAGPRTLVTAGHCVYDAAMGGWASEIIVRPGRNGSAQPFDAIRTTRFSTTQRWWSHRDVTADYAAIHLPDDAMTITEQTGWFSTSAQSDAALRHQLVNVSGYPYDKGGATQWFHAKQIVHVSPGTLHYDVDTFGGQSGAPVWLHSADGPEVVAIHAYGVGSSNADVPSNSGPRITAGALTLIRQWINQ